MTKDHKQPTVPPHWLLDFFRARSASNPGFIEEHLYRLLMLVSLRDGPLPLDLDAIFDLVDGPDAQEELPDLDIRALLQGILERFWDRSAVGWTHAVVERGRGL